MLNQRDLDVLNVMYQSNEGMTGTDIVNAGDGMTQSTVMSVLRKLMREKLVEVTGVTHCGKVLARQFQPTAKCKEAVKDHFVESYAKFRDIVKPEEIYQAIKQREGDENENG